MNASTDNRKLIEESLKKIRLLTQENHSLKAQQQEPIAMVGVACRFPGSSNSMEDFWQNLLAQKNMVEPMQQQRWDHARYFSESGPAKGKTYSPQAGLLDNILRFDADLFHITPHEAECMDPQQRLLLEVSWEALENAGYPLDKIRGANAGVFVGVMNKDHSDLLVQQLSLEEISAQMNAGNHESVHAGRLSYFFDLKGPCLTLNTACSSSLVCVHLACQSLHMKECDFALAAGCNLLLSPAASVAQSQAMMHSAHGYCKTFDADAAGYVRAEGVGVVVLKRLSDAIAAGDYIHAIIKGSAVNQDGTSQGISAPNGPAQERVMRRALKNANVEAKDIAFVESHGTGTKLGDPIEARSLGAVYGRAPGRTQPLLVGAVKTNMGHAESAAGMAGLIKLVKVIQAGTIPPNLHFNQVNPHIDLNHENIALCNTQTQWPEQNLPNHKRMGAVSAFGFSGTNAHIIVESYNHTVSVDNSVDNSECTTHLIKIAGKNQSALHANINKTINFLNNNSNTPLADICHSYNVGRNDFNCRVIATGTTKEALIKSLQQQQNNADNKKLPRINCVFVFSDQVATNLLSDENNIRALPQIYQLFNRALEQLNNIENKTVDLTRWSENKDCKVTQSYCRLALISATYYFWQELGCDAEVFICTQQDQEIIQHLLDGLSLVQIATLLQPTLTNKANEQQVHEQGQYIVWSREYKTKSTLITLRQLKVQHPAINTVSGFANQMLMDTLVSEKYLYALVPSVWTPANFMTQVAEKLSVAYQKFEGINPAAWYSHLSVQKTPVSSYAFQGQEYWLPLISTDKFFKGTHKALDAQMGESRAAENQEVIYESSTAAVLDVIARISKITASEISPQLSLMQDLGFDSIMLMELRAKIIKLYPSLLDIPLDILFGKDIQSLLDYVNETSVSQTTAIFPTQTIENELPEIIDWISTWGAALPAQSSLRLDKKWVHKSLSSNVLLNNIAQTSKDNWFVAEVYRDNEHSFFYEHPQDHIPGLYLIEASRQFGLVCAHMFHNVPHTHPFVLDEMKISFERFADKNQALFLAACYTDTYYLNGILQRTNSQCYIIQNGVILGSISGRGTIMNKASYAKKREPSAEVA